MPASVIAYAARLLPAMAPGLAAPEAVRSDPGRLAVVAAAPQELTDRVAEQVRDLLAGPGSLGVIVADDQVATVAGALTAAGIEHGVLGADHGDVAHRVDVVPATVAKGLEFDAVVVVEPSRIAAAEPDARTGLRRLYVVLTRAVSRLVVVHAEPLPPLLASGVPEE
ncbi:ATP-binding domain-containing protein [Arsenicicoccus dermatophilus]|uniref:ATP-binding domain-containing protein n=1 Tax=Arsenicicoccus dermatophilus TaxID=1076331 RepID=UPI0039173CBA